MNTPSSPNAVDFLGPERGFAAFRSDFPDAAARNDIFRRWSADGMTRRYVEELESLLRSPDEICPNATPDVLFGVMTGLVRAITLATVPESVRPGTVTDTVPGRMLPDPDYSTPPVGFVPEA